MDVTTIIDTDADIICGSTTTLSPFALAQVAAQPATIGPVSLWMGLTSGADRGLRFDVRAEAYRNGNELIAFGELHNVPGGGPGFGNAGHSTIPMTPNGTVTLPPGSSLNVKIFVRNACDSTGLNGTARPALSKDESRQTVRQFERRLGLTD